MYSILKAFSLVGALVYSAIQAQRRIEVHTIQLQQDLCTMTCLSGWLDYNFTCLQFINEQKTWIEAEVYCQNLVPGSHLASIHSNENNDFVLSLVQQAKSIHPKVWIGSSDFYKDNVQLWTDGSRWDYQNWLAGTPISGSLCNTMNLLYDSGFWSDGNCATSQYPFICMYSFEYD